MVWLLELREYFGSPDLVVGLGIEAEQVDVIAR